MIDDVSLEILRILQDKARIPNVEVSRQIGLAPSAVLERIRKMEKQGIIDGYEVRLNPERFGRSLVGFILVAPAAGAAGKRGQQQHLVRGCVMRPAQTGTVAPLGLDDGDTAIDGERRFVSSRALHDGRRRGTCGSSDGWPIGRKASPTTSG